MDINKGGRSTLFTLTQDSYDPVPSTSTSVCTFDGGFDVIGDADDTILVEPVVGASGHTAEVALDKVLGLPLDMIIPCYDSSVMEDAVSLNDAGILHDNIILSQGSIGMMDPNYFESCEEAPKGLKRPLDSTASMLGTPSAPNAGGDNTAPKPDAEASDESSWVEALWKKRKYFMQAIPSKLYLCRQQPVDTTSVQCLHICYDNICYPKYRFEFNPIKDLNGRPLFCLKLESDCDNTNIRMCEYEWKNKNVCGEKDKIPLMSLANGIDKIPPVSLSYIDYKSKERPTSRMWSPISCPDNSQELLQNRIVSLNLSEVLLSDNVSGNGNLLCARCVVNCNVSICKTLFVKTEKNLDCVKDVKEHPLAYILNVPLHKDNAKDLFDRSCLLQSVVSRNMEVGSLEYNNPASINDLIESMSGMWTDQFMQNSLSQNEQKWCYTYMFVVRNRSAVVRNGYQATVNSCINMAKAWLYNPNESKDLNKLMGIDQDEELEHQEEMISHLENILPTMSDVTCMTRDDMPLFIDSMLLRNAYKSIYKRWPGIVCPFFVPQFKENKSKALKAFDDASGPQRVRLHSYMPPSGRFGVQLPMVDPIDKKTPLIHCPLMFEKILQEHPPIVQQSTSMPIQNIPSTLYLNTALNTRWYVNIDNVENINLVINSVPPEHLIFLADPDKNVPERHMAWRDAKGETHNLCLWERAGLSYVDIFDLEKSFFMYDVYSSLHESFVNKQGGIPLLHITSLYGEIFLSPSTLFEIDKSSCTEQYIPVCELCVHNKALLGIILASSLQTKAMLQSRNGNPPHGVDPLFTLLHWNRCNPNSSMSLTKDLIDAASILFSTAAISLSPGELCASEFPTVAKEYLRVPEKSLPTFNQVHRLMGKICSDLWMIHPQNKSMYTKRPVIGVIEVDCDIELVMEWYAIRVREIKEYTDYNQTRITIGSRSKNVVISEGLKAIKDEAKWKDAIRIGCNSYKSESINEWKPILPEAILKLWKQVIRDKAFVESENRGQISQEIAVVLMPSNHVQALNLKDDLGPKWLYPIYIDTSNSARVKAMLGKEFLKGRKFVPVHFGGKAVRDD